MAEPRYRYQEPRCYTLTLTWLPSEEPEDLACDEPEDIREPPSRHTPPLRPHRRNRPRDVVRHHRERRLRHVVEIVRRERREDIARGWETDEDVLAIARKRANTSARCHCRACMSRKQKPSARNLRLAAREAADDADLLPPSPEDDATIYWLREWYRNDYPVGADRWPPLCDECPVVECWEVAGGEACRQAMLRQHRLDLAPIDEDAEAYWDLMDSGDVPGEWPPSVPSAMPDHDDD